MPTEFASLPTMAFFLDRGYWLLKGQDQRHWTSSSITVNVSDLSSAEQALAVSAFNAWAELTTLQFVFTSGPANITFNNDSPDAWASTNVSAGQILSATISISSSWSSGADGGIGSYFYQTYLHEIGHALGLGHMGPYNEFASYETDAIYTNDTWQWSVMSYFSQDEGPFDSSSQYVLTPQMADIYAIQSMYGANVATRSGNTVYGFNTTAGSLYDFNQYVRGPAFTIYDTGGADTLDCSGYDDDQTISLMPGTWSSIGGNSNNIGISTSTIIENALGGGGNDHIYGNDIANTLQGGKGEDFIDGQSGYDTLYGGDGDDIIVGANGRDTIYGGDGWDTLVGGQDHDEIHGGAGDDLIQDYGDGFNYFLGEDGNDRIYGGDWGDDIYGGGGNDLLDGGLDNDLMVGGAGDDQYYVDHADDWISENANEGIDTVLSTISFVLGANFERLTLLGSDAINGTGNGVDNTLTGNSGANTLTGGLGNDIYIVNAGDTINEASGQGTGDRARVAATFALAADDNIEFLETTSPTLTTTLNLTGNEIAQTITGNAGNNVLVGLGGNDTLVGNAGNDTLTGGLGNDIYVVGAGDNINESSNQGADRARAAATFALATGDNIEFLETTNAALTTALNLTGNEIVQTITGNAGANSLFGLGGNDTLSGLGGNDTLDGGIGNDILTGGIGNDIYIVNTGDNINEASGQGTADRARAAATFALASGDNIEFLETTNAALATAINLTGNEIAQTITGNGGANTLSGLAGNDTLISHGGIDTLLGGLGNDTMTGGAGNDFFVFDTALNASTNRDSITDYNVAADTIRLENAIFTAISQSSGTLAASRFFVGTAAHDADDRIIYNATTGALIYDSNGNASGGAIQFATLTTHPGGLTNADFVII